MIENQISELNSFIDKQNLSEHKLFGHYFGEQNKLFYQAANLSISTSPNSDFATIV